MQVYGFFDVEPCAKLAVFVKDRADHCF